MWVGSMVLDSTSTVATCRVDGGGLPEFHGVGWGGVGMLTFLTHAHMLDATQQDVSLGLAHMFDATQQDVSLGLAHMFDATEHWGGVGWGC